MNGQYLYLGPVSLVIALTAVAVAVWQARTNAVAAEKSNSLPVASHVFAEFRSQEFRAHLLRVWTETPSDVPDDGFQALPQDWRESAYAVAYFFEHLGLLVAYELIPQNFILDCSSHALVRSWRTLEPFIHQERVYRQRTADLSPNFVSHFEHLAVIAAETNSHGKYIDDLIHEQIRLRKFN